MPPMTASVLAKLILLAPATMAAGASGLAEDAEDPQTSLKSGYAPVNGLRIYYEIHGTERGGCPPLVLLHGGGDTIQTSFGKILPLLARGRQVIAFEQQGHGHTADVDGRPFGFESSADDTAALLEYLQVGQADLLGFSNGGTIAQQVAIRHPQVVRRLVVASGLFRRSGAYDWLWAAMAQAQLENMPKELQDAYLQVAPHPDNLRSFHDKAAQRMRAFEDIPDEAIRGIAAPALVVVGDSDVVRPEHAVELFRLVRQAQLAVAPGTEHMALMGRTELLAPLVEEFLDSEMSLGR